MSDRVTERTPRLEELHRLPWLQADDRVDESVPGWVEPPCQRPGADNDWWRDQHAYCTGGRHLGLGVVVICACGCHVDRQHAVLPSPAEPRDVGESDGS